MRKLVNLLKVLGKIIFLAAGAAVLYAYAMFQGGFVSWFLFYSFLPFLLFSLLFALYPFWNWKIERIIDMHKTYEAGDTVKVQIQLMRKLPFPLYFLIITDTFPAEKGEHKLVLYPLFKRKMTVTYELTEIPRGEHFFGDITVSSADFLGLIKKEYSFQVESKLIVYPKRQRLNLSFLDKHIGEGALARGLDLKNETIMPTGTREYQRGDRLSWINWKMTARKSTLISKEFDRTEDHHYVICMDRSREISPDNFEKIVHYTASFMGGLYPTGHPFTLISGGADRNVFSSKKSMEGRNQLLYHFAIVTNDSPHVLPKVVEREKAALPERRTTILVTDRITPSLLNWLEGSANKQGKIIVMLTSLESMQKYSKQPIHQNIIIKAIDEDVTFARLGVNTV